MKGNNLDKYKVLLVTLITSLSITGIGFIDNQIWNVIMLIVGMTAYAIVGLLYSLNLISGKNAGKEAYGATFIMLIIMGYCIYEGIISFQRWLLSWPLCIKILVPIIILSLIAITIVLMIKKSKNDKIQQVRTE